MFNTSMILGCNGEIVDEIYIGDRLQTHFQWDAYGFNNAFIYIIMQNDRIVSHYARRIKRNPEGW
jgi:hypothetical protein